MDRFIDTVMLGSDRVDEQARLITRLSDSVGALVGDLGPATAELVRAALLAATGAHHRRPLDVVADVLVHLAAAVGDATVRCHPSLSPGQALALGACDGHGLTDYALGASIGIDRDEVATARDEARRVIGLPPAPAACTRRHPATAARATCVACMLVRADTAAARARVSTQVGVPDGVVIHRVVAHARHWQDDRLRPRPLPTGAGPTPWTAVAGLTA